MDKQILFDAVEASAPLLTALSDQIWDYAELSMQEHRSAESYVQLLREQGFQVEEALCNIPTAFLGRYGSGKPVIGILGEFDALSGLSQAPCVAEKQPLTPGGNGHGCGHNLLGAASLGAAIAIKEQIQKGSLSGTVVFYGCPGEEGYAGKTFMAQGGMFRDLDAALCWHPGDTNEITTGSNAASIQKTFTFTGLAAHAAGDPEHGRSALDAAELMNVGVQFLREHMSPTCCLHYSFLDAGGISPNVVQPTATVLYMVRGENVREAKALLARVEKIAQGAALMTETAVTSSLVDGSSDTVSNTVLEKLLLKNFQATPLPTYTPQEWEFAESLKATCGEPFLPGQWVRQSPTLKAFSQEMTDGGRRALNDFLMPYTPSLQMSPGSTDVGDVSWLTPTAQFTALTWVSGSPGHSWQNVATGKHAIAHKGMLLAAKVLAATAADLMEQPDILKAARQEFESATVAGYDCPLNEN